MSQDSLAARTLKHRLWGRRVSFDGGSFAISDIRRAKDSFIVYDDANRQCLHISSDQRLPLRDGVPITVDGVSYSAEIKETFPMPSKHRIDRLVGKHIKKNLDGDNIIISINDDGAPISAVTKWKYGYVIRALRDDGTDFPFAHLQDYQMAEFVDRHAVNIGPPCKVSLNSNLQNDSKNHNSLSKC